MLKSPLDEGCKAFTVDISLAESLNALWKHVEIHGDLSEEEAKQAVDDLLRIWDGLNIVPGIEVAEEAFNIALQHGITAYDAPFIAASRKTTAKLYTADMKLHETSKKIATSELLS